MSLLNQIDDKGAVLAWSPLREQSNLVALGTKDSAGTGFDDLGGELELHALDVSSSDYKTRIVGKARASGRFSSIAWSQMYNFQNNFNMGLIAGGTLDGVINVWDPSKIVSGDENSLLACVEQHQGAITSLRFNPHKESSHLLASGGSDTEIYVMSLEHPDQPSVFIPAPPPNNTKHTADITQVAWNSQVAHILASAAQNGSCCVWDLRQKRAWCELRDPSGGSVSDIAWNPDQGLHIITASGDDKNPVLKLWDLRSSTSLPLATLQGGHSEGILSISWCPTDTSLLLSCGKDNRTILWDLFSLQPVYDLPSISAGGARGGHDEDNSVFGGFASSATNRRYNVTWSPCMPAVVSASSFDRKVQFFSMTGARNKLGRAPKWLRRPVGATFGFGGKLVTINNINAATAAAAAPGKKAAAGGKLKVYQVAENKDLVAASDIFNEAVSNGQLKQFCESKCEQFADATTPASQVWSLMKVICFGTNAREELLTYLGFDSATITSHAQTYLAAQQLATMSVGDQSPSSAQDIFGSDVAATAAVAATPTVDFTSLNAQDTAKLQGMFSTMKSAEEAEPTIREAIIVGNFEMAVDCCLKAGLLAEALLLAQCGGQELRVKTQAAFFERQRLIHPFLNVLHAVIKSQLMEFVTSSDLRQWRETLALLSTYGKSEEFTSLCEALANRLEIEAGNKPSAALCYMCATNVARTVQFWTEELQAANAAKGQLDTLALQEYVEKVMVFTQANPVETLGPECGAFFAKYAELLSSQGKLSCAAIYLKGDSEPVKILVDRLYHAGNKPPGSKPPAFPFEKIQVDVQTQRAAVAVAPVAAAQPTNQPAAASHFSAHSDVTAVASQQQHQRGQQRSSAAAAAVASATAAAHAATSAVHTAVPTPAPAPAAPALPAGWLQLIDPASNMPYYVNQATGQSQWEPPIPAAAPAPVVQPPAAPAAHQQFSAHANPSQPAMMHTSSQPTIQQSTQPAVQPVAQPQPQVQPQPAAVIISEADRESIVAIGQMIEVVAISNTTPAEKKQIVMLRQAYTHLNDKMKANEISPEILQKLGLIAEHLSNRNYAGATAIQTDLANTAWGPHKDWIKGIKILIQLACRK